MVLYANLNRGSGVAGYDLGADSITVYFHGGDGYVYTYRSTGVQWVDHMRTLASSGRGLSTFIAQTVKDRYERKFRWRSPDRVIGPGAGSSRP